MRKMAMMVAGLGSASSASAGVAQSMISRLMGGGALARQSAASGTNWIHTPSKAETVNNLERLALVKNAMYAACTEARTGGANSMRRYGISASALLPAATTSSATYFGNVSATVGAGSKSSFDGRSEAWYRNGFYIGAIGTMAATSTAAVSYADSEKVEDVTLYQYAVCPFCNKVRAALDYYNVPYKIVEVNPLTKTEIKWSTYKKVPIVSLSGDSYTNSSDIMIQIKKQYDGDVSSKKGYFFGSMGKAAREAAEKEEAKWLKWVDDKLVHYLPPNIYRNRKEAMQAFEYITKEGNFGFWESEAARYFGAGAMYFLTHYKLKKKYGIDKEREEIYEKLDEFVNAIGPNRTFLGGENPNLADLAVFGVIRAISGMDTFTDIMLHTKLQPWYAKMSSVVGESSRLEIKDA